MTKTETRKRVHAIIKESAAHMRKNIDKVFNSGAIDISSAPDDNILPLTIFNALLKEELFQHNAKGTKWEKQIKKDSDNIFNMI